MNTAILFDTVSIQQYVFGSNKLRDNLGASYIIEHIYMCLEEVAKNNPNKIEIGYIGGGNALIFTSTEENAKEIIQEFSKELLWKCPGVSVAVAIKDNFDRENYSDNIKELFQRLAANKGKYHPVNTISSHGITSVCKFSSLSVERIDQYGDSLSSTTVTKRIFEEKAREEEKILLQGEVLGDKYSFPDELDHLGQKKGEDSHIAVVHIDGNGFGNVFRNLDLDATKKLSSDLSKNVRDAFVHTLSTYASIENKIENLIDQRSYLNNILPIRPIVLGGDDVTFVCHGKLGILFAEIFMQKFNSNKYIDHKGEEQEYSSCAGVAIVKTKYPFYRAYQLAEELCNSAKSARKKYMDDTKIKNGGNWIDFQLAYSGLGNSLEEVRKLQYFDIKGNKSLHNRPYCIEKMGVQISINELKTYASTLKTTLPNSKIKDLREVLTRDKDSQKVLIEHFKHQHNEDKGFKKEFCENLTTTEILDNYPFFDMIELLELYPVNLLNE